MTFIYIGALPEAKAWTDGRGTRSGAHGAIPTELLQKVAHSARRHRNNDDFTIQISRGKLRRAARIEVVRCVLTVSGGQPSTSPPRAIAHQNKTKEPSEEGTSVPGATESCVAATEARGPPTWCAPRTLSPVHSESTARAELRRRGGADIIRTITSRTVLRGRHDELQKQ